jgi:ABC-type sugar transport system permease subunit
MLKKFKQGWQSLKTMLSKGWRFLTKPFHRLTQRLSNRQREAVVGYAFISIWLVGFIFLTAIPLIESFIFSFHQITIVGGEGIRLFFTGLTNYIRIFSTDLEFLSRLQRFIGEMIIFLPVMNILALMIAILLNRKFKFRGFFRAIFFLPVIITSGPVIAELLRQGAGTIPTLSESGIFEIIANGLPRFLSEPIQSLFTQIIFMLWFSGVQVVLYLAGLQKLDQSMYEAAQIDGANAWESFWKITLPSLRPMILVASIYTIVTLATFANNPIILLISNVMFDPNKGYGYASGLAWIYFLVIALLLLITTALINPKEKGYRVVKEYQRYKR